jgi:hypothetical protein
MGHLYVTGRRFVIEVTAPDMRRVHQPDLCNVPLLQFGSGIPT